TGESVFDRLKERVRRELLVVKLFGVVREQLTRPDSAPTFEQIRDLYDFKLSPPVKLDAAKTVTQPEFGSPAASAAIFEGFRTGALKPGDVLDYAAEPKVAKGAVDEPGRSVSIWRVLGRREARDPTIDDPGVLDKAIAKYKEKKRQDEVKRLAEEFRKAVEEKTAAAAKPAEEKAEADAKAAIEAEISKQGLSRDDPQHKAKIVSLEAQENAKKAAAVAEARAAAEPEAFRAVAGEKSYVVRETGWMRKNVARPAQFRAEDAETLSLDEKLARFFRKPIRMNQLAALKAGRMGQVDLEPAWAAAAVSRLVERREPKPTDLYALSEAQMSQLKRAAAPTTPVSWNYEAFKSPQWFHLDAPNLEEARKERADRAARDAERTRREEERKNETKRRRAAKLVEDFRDPASPIKSGEGW
ncbi:MAG TPA: hypothetical protein VEI02_05480, partial [Planctomycetota bacterium]|nr:hypothetical protein [Planctomycetota bacterium]